MKRCNLLYIKYGPTWWSGMCVGVVLQRVGELVVLVEGQERRVEGRRRGRLQTSLQLLGGAGS